ncbi:DNA topoisomerase VI subunit A [Aureococcus anophagefferens]|nr:DNA topoisomerase VI subunit A [Aureococcus anophagefferens]
MAPKKKQKKAAAPEAEILDPEVVLKEVRRCRALLATQKPVDMSTVDLSGMRVVDAMPADDVAYALEALFVAAAESIMRGESFKFDVPSRSATNQHYVRELDRIVLKHNTSERSFTNVGQVRKTAIMTRVFSLVHEVVTKGIHVTKRDLFYTDVKLFKKQEESDAVLDDAACVHDRFHEDGDPIDCTRMGVTGKAIPAYIDKISNIRSDAEFILLVEKDAAYNRLAEDRFYNQFPCILITGKGQPDVATRMFLSRLKAELKIPVLAFVDSDPYGLKILSTSAGLPMTPKDIEMGKQLLKEDFVLKNKQWVKELERMLHTKQKAEIQALSAFGFQFVTQVYLPRKLRQGDWI